MTVDPPVRLDDLQRWRAQRRPWVAVSAASTPQAALLDRAGVPVVVCGDMAVARSLGHPDVLAVTLDDMVRATRAVVRGVRRALVVADLPFGTYRRSRKQAMTSAERMIAQAGAHAVSLEGGREVTGAVRALTEAGIPVIAHVGHTPQRQHILGGQSLAWRAKDVDSLVEDVVDLAAAGAAAVVLEGVDDEVAARTTEVVDIPTIGLRSGRGCTAVFVEFEELVGLAQPSLTLPAPYADWPGAALDALARLGADVASGSFPGRPADQPGGARGGGSRGAGR